MSDENSRPPISINDAARQLERPFEPADLVTVNDAIVRIAAIEGEFPWHHHDEDELFAGRGPSGSSSRTATPSSSPPARSSSSLEASSTIPSPSNAPSC
jgi:hypothetical protein